MSTQKNLDLKFFSIGRCPHRLKWNAHTLAITKPKAQ